MQRTRAYPPPATSWQLMNVQFLIIQSGAELIVISQSKPAKLPLINSADNPQKTYDAMRTINNNHSNSLRDYHRIHCFQERTLYLGLSDGVVDPINFETVFIMEKTKDSDIIRIFEQDKPTLQKDSKSSAPVNENLRLINEELIKICDDKMNSCQLIVAYWEHSGKIFILDKGDIVAEVRYSGFQDQLRLQIDMSQFRFCQTKLKGSYEIDRGKNHICPHLLMERYLQLLEILLKMPERCSMCFIIQYIRWLQYEVYIQWTSQWMAINQLCQQQVMHKGLESKQREVPL
ncbi:MAG: hypothetical protein EZS28_009499 [Streblomastix strix]|uniref:Uncharacterized protein n=1 Tax=Streblomastix strix TaxID=222440 RepID=A0A5J4WKU7_9EUKA|nr:MAG: hypothetical protein EZS28_009499 [Streblomastix strix]